MQKRIFGVSLNKFFALVFSSLALLCLVAELTMSITLYGAAFALSFSRVIDYLLLFGSFILLLVMNIRNDDRAYYAVTLIVFYIGFDGFYGIGNTISNVASFMEAQRYVPALLSALSMFLWSGQLAMGIMTYITIFRYRLGRTNNFKLLFLFASLFVLSLLLTTASSLAIYFAQAIVSALGIATTVLFYLSQIFAGVAILFTLKRLRRF